MKQIIFPDGNGCRIRCRRGPYFRIFNPILQGEKFDKQGEYVKKWIPELKMFLQSLYINLKLNDNKILKLGSDYPKPIVIHEKARLKALSI